MGQGGQPGSAFNRSGQNCCTLKENITYPGAVLSPVVMYSSCMMLEAR